MSTVYSNERTVDLAEGRKGNHPAAFGGKVRVIGATYTTPSAGLTSGDVIELFTLPKGAVLLGGAMAWEAMGAGCTAKVGDAGDVDKYLGSTDVSGAGYSLIGNTIALYAGQKLQDDKVISLTTGGGNFAGDKEIKIGFFVNLGD